MQSAAGSAPTYDVIVVGGGSGGYACALRAAQLGLSVALIEQADLGGTCLHRGCIPTKALLHAAEVADSARTAASFGVTASFESIDMAAVNRYKDGVVRRLHRGLQGLVSAASIEYVHGTARLTSAHAVSVGDTILTGRSVVVATGSRSRVLSNVPIGGRIITSDQALTWDSVPARVVILGGGVIGVEFASIYRSFGAEVTIVEALDRLVASEDEAISTALARAFRKRGITARTSTVVDGAEDLGDVARVALDDGSTIEADLLLVAIGRAPVSEDLGLDLVGVRTERGFVTTDERLQTSVAGIYAVGDVVPGLQLAHRGFAQGIFVAEQIAGLDPTPIEEHGIPRVTYSDPEIVSVGLTEQQVRDSAGTAICQELSLAGNGKSQILGTTGFVKLVRSTSDGPVLGVHMIGGRMSEQAGEAQLIVNWEAMPDEVASMIHAHPTQNEALGEAHLALAGKPLHSHT
ncbi:MAG: dihydrolipoyl dehydrogenase [Ornithinimicrobium sp.]